MYGLTAGPYGSVLALCWKRETNAVWLLLLDFAQGMSGRGLNWGSPLVSLLSCG